MNSNSSASATMRKGWSINSSAQPVLDRNNPLIPAAEIDCEPESQKCCAILFDVFLPRLAHDLSFHTSGFERGYSGSLPFVVAGVGAISVGGGLRDRVTSPPGMIYRIASRFRKLRAVPVRRRSRGRRWPARSPFPSHRR